MEIEDLEIRDYLGQCAPLNKLSVKDLNQIVSAIEISYHRKADVLLKQDETNHSVYLIRSGAFEVFNESGYRLGHYSEGDWLGYRSALSDGVIKLSVTASEDSLLYRLPANLMRQFMRRHKNIEQYFSLQKPQRIKAAIEDIREINHTNLIQQPVTGLIHGEPLVVQADESILSVAKLMQQRVYTAALVYEKKQLVGIVTDRAYCTKVVADNISSDLPIREVMSKEVICLNKSNTGTDALLLMAQNNIRHVPIVDGDELLGVITATDLIRQQSHHSLYLINEISRATELQLIISLSQQTPNVMQNLVANGMTTYDVGRLITSIAEAIIKRLIYLAEQVLGKPPVKYAFVVAGSMARQEQTVVTDQDNALFLSDDYDVELHHAYFESLSHYICDGLNACGYVYCPGEVMATNTKWRQRVSVWKKYYSDWITEPEPKALMYASVFFDVRCVAGDKNLLNDVQASMLEITKSNTIFLKHMTDNALSFHPPIGMFRQFVLEKHGKENKALNMKKRGLVPIIDMVRVYALAAGINIINTQQRLKKLEEVKQLSESGAEDLNDAFELIASVRIKHQCKQINEAESPDNYLNPLELSSLERRHLKDAFDVIREFQIVLAQRYT